MSSFLSLPFALILVAAFFVRWSLPSSYRAGGWLVLSYVFYGLQGPWLPLVLALLTLVTAWGSARLRNIPPSPSRQRQLAFFVVLALLPFFATKWGKVSDLMVTVGLSFASFNAIACLSAAYFDDEPRPSFLELALHLAFFPKLLQGPLANPDETILQFRNSDAPDSQQLKEGFQRFLWGAFQKAVIADRLAAFADPLWAPNSAIGGAGALLGLYLFAAQIYFDLKGYSDMAIGSALLLGIRLPENFNRPFYARSIAEFWKRWHMTFSRWLLRQIFEPLQMAWRHWGRAGSAGALFTAFILVGLWHGVNGRFLAFGIYHGCLVASTLYVEMPLKNFYKKLGLWQKPALLWIQVVVTFHLVLISLILFRAKDLGHVGAVLSALAQALVQPRIEWGKLSFWLYESGALAELGLLISLLCFATLCGVYARTKNWNAWPTRWRWIAYWILAFAVLLMGRLVVPKEFIYAQF